MNTRGVSRVAIVSLLGIASSACSLGSRLNQSSFGGGRTPPSRVSDPTAQGDLDLESPVAAGSRVFYITIVPGPVVRYRIYVCAVGQAPPTMPLAEFAQRPRHLTGTPAGVVYFSLGGTTLYRLAYTGDLTKVDNAAVREILGIAAAHSDIVVLGDTGSGVQLFTRNGSTLQPIPGTNDATALTARLIATRDNRVAYAATTDESETLRGFANGTPFVTHRAKAIGEAEFVNDMLFFVASDVERHASLWRSDANTAEGVDVEVTSPRHLRATGSRLHVIAEDGDGESMFAVSSLGEPDPVVYRNFSPFGPATEIRGFATYGDRILVIARYENEYTAWNARTSSNAPFLFGHYSPGQLTSPRACLSTAVSATPCVALLGGDDQLWIAIAQGCIEYPYSESDGAIRPMRLVQTDDDLWFVASYRGHAALYLSVNTTATNSVLVKNNVTVATSNTAPTLATIPKPSVR